MAWRRTAPKIHFASAADATKTYCGHEVNWRSRFVYTREEAERVTCERCRASLMRRGLLRRPIPAEPRVEEEMVVREVGPTPSRIKAPVTPEDNEHELWMYRLGIISSISERR